jgi:hypothetical protein
MPKAKPVSLYPLTFEESITAILKAEPKPAKKRKRRKRKLSKRVR